MSRGSMIMFVGLLPVGRLAAEGNSSLSESKVETAEHAVTAETLLAQNEELRRQLSIAQESLRALTSSLAESNAEAELFRRKYSDLELRMEALGLASANKDRAKLEQRLLAAVSDLRLTQKERDEFRDQLLGLNEALLRYLQTSQGGDAQARMDVEMQLRKTSELVGGSTSAAAQEPQRRMSILQPARSFCAIAFPRPFAPARRHPAMSANIATAPRSNRGADRETHRALFASIEDRSPRRAIVARALRDLYSPTPAQALPSAAPNRNTCGETVPLRRSIPPGSPSKS